MKSLAVIGFGGRASHLVSRLLAIAPHIRLAAIADPNRDAVHTHLQKQQRPVTDMRVFSSAEELLDSGDYDAFIIGSRCSSHAPLAVEIAPRNKPLLLEKPVAISREQLLELHEAYRGHEQNVLVSFPLRFTPLFTAALEIIRSGRLGAINQIQAWNYVNYGGVYFAKWYRNYNEVGGLWLQKATHDFDYINALAGSQPQIIAAMSNRIAMGGDKPFDLTCSTCDEKATCLESPQSHAQRGDHGGMGWDDHHCPFSEGIENQDSGCALIQYANGIQASYAQNFITRRTAEARGAIITGYEGTLEFDWYTSSIRVTEHHRDRVDNIEVKATTSHLGGDEVLIQQFADMVTEQASSMAPLQDGILSVAMCLAARESCQTHSFQTIDVPGIRASGRRPPCTLVEPTGSPAEVLAHSL